MATPLEQEIMKEPERAVAAIWFSRESARSHRDSLRMLGRHPRVYPRTASAEGKSQRVYVIVADVPPEKS